MTQSLATDRVAAVARSQAPPAPAVIGVWQLDGLAGRGPYCDVYRVRPVGAPDDVPGAYALKLLRPPHEDDRRLLQLIAREALVGRRVSHPNLVPILASNITSRPRWLVMPWLEGHTLRMALTQGRQFELPEALWVVRQAAEALEALRLAGWTHGDVKPENVFISPEGHATLTDLGFAHRLDDRDRGDLRCVLGSIGYLAPECLLAGCPSSPRGDAYSLGLVLAELLLSRHPKHGQRPLVGMNRHVVLEALCGLLPPVPEPLLALLQSMLANDPLRRPEPWREIIDRLAEVEIASFSERAW